MEKHSHNSYLKELETSLATIKATLIENEENTHNIYKNALITQKASEANKRDLKKYLDKAMACLDNMSGMNKTASEIKLLSEQTVAMAKAAANDESESAKNIATAARSLEQSMESTAILSSIAASIKTKAASEDANTKISRMAEEAYQKGLEAATATELATMSSLESTIMAAESNARYIQDYITQFSANIVSLSQAINTTMQSAKTNADTIAANYQAALNTCSANDSALAIADLNYQSAKSANAEENIKLGLQEAYKLVKENDKKAETTKK